MLEKLNTAQSVKKSTTHGAIAWCLILLTDQQHDLVEQGDQAMNNLSHLKFV